MPNKYKTLFKFLKVALQCLYNVFYTLSDTFYLNFQLKLKIDSKTSTFENLNISKTFGNPETHFHNKTISRYLKNWTLYSNSAEIWFGDD